MPSRSWRAGNSRSLNPPPSSTRSSSPPSKHTKSSLHYHSSILESFTATDAANLDDGFKSRLHQIKFSSYGNAPAVTAFLEQVWAAEATNLDAPPPNFARIVKEANGSIRDCLNFFSHKFMMSEHPNAPFVRAVCTGGEVRCSHHPPKLTPQQNRLSSELNTSKL